nr:hypothetical protein [Vibrio salilacus]
MNRAAAVLKTLRIITVTSISLPVLMVHSTGNSRSDDDIKPSVPNRYSVHSRSKPISTWLDVSASVKYAEVVFETLQGQSH